MALIPLGEEKAYVPKGEKIEVDIIEKWRDMFIIFLIIAFILTIVLIPDSSFILVEGIEVNSKLIILAAILILIARISIVRFLEYERGVIFRLGKFQRVAGPGLEVVIPMVEKLIRRDLRLKVYTLEPQEVVTEDKVRFLVSPEIFMYVHNPKDSVMNVEDYEKAVLQYVNSALNHVCGDSTSDYIVAHMDEISGMLEHSIEKISNLPGKEWGVVVPKIKVGFVRFPDEVQSAMHKKVAAEQLKLAAYEKADAIKVEIDAIREAGSKLTDPAITYLYLEALDKVARGRATKIVLPLEISRIAEGITKSASSTLTATPEISLPPDLIQKYKDSIENYERRLKEIEDKLAKMKITGEKIEKEGGKKELDEYKMKIREIKKRVGI